MPSATANLAFPYSVPADALNTVDDTMQALADAVDTYLAPGTVGGHTIGSGITDGGVTLYRLLDSAGLLNVNVSTAAAQAAGKVILTLPVGFRPPATIWGTLVGVTGSETACRVHVNADGTVAVQPAIAAGTIIRGSVVIPLA